jgi:DNA topoisomerase IB
MVRVPEIEEQLRAHHTEESACCVRWKRSPLPLHRKSGKQWSLRVKNRRIAKIIRACQELPGQELHQYLDADGKPQDITSSDVNAYLKEITGKDITAKDFRTWAGTVLAVRSDGYPP